MNILLKTSINITNNNNGKVHPPRCKLNEKDLEQVADSRYLGVTLQENLRFSQHIEAKITTAKKQLGMIKRALFWAPQRIKLLAYKSLCMPHQEYAAAAWDTSNEGKITSMEQVQNQAVWFIAELKGTRGISEAIAKLGLPPLKQRRKQQRLQLLSSALSVPFRPGSENL